jgi:hypothetical protein
MNDREKMLAAGVISAGMKPEGLRVRRLSAASVIMLELLGNPLAGLPREGEEVSVYAVAEYAWLHAAPLDDVRVRVVGHELHPAATKLAVLEWAQGYTEEELLEVVAQVRAEAAAAGDALVVCEEGGDGGNEYGPCS